QLLAEIESPEVDQQLKQSQANTQQAQAEVEQAKADAEQARTQLELARVNLKRSQTLVAQGVSSQQEVDDAQAMFNARQAAYNAGLATIGARQAAVGANRADVNRLVELQSFEQIKAPFDGVITLRSVDNGALVTSGSTNASRELFRLAQSNTLRIMVNVPQTFVASIKKGHPVRIEIREMPGQVFTAVVARTTNSLDISTRTLRTEIDLPNSDGKLLPGMYAQISFAVSQENPPLIIPASALIVRADGTQLAIVDKENKVHFRKVGVGRDLGSEIEIISGYAGEERLVTNPNDELHEGTIVKTISPKK
ncbi:MAG: efflux RND transporter periplasmic adaptor subunit, partial [Pyrinomonadaceae bacterium]